MADCRACGQLMPSALSCTTKRITFPDGETRERLRYSASDGKACPDCGVSDGGFHHLSSGSQVCEAELCPRCGGQLLVCWLRGECRA